MQPRAFGDIQVSRVVEMEIYPLDAFAMLPDMTPEQFNRHRPLFDPYYTDYANKILRLSIHAYVVRTPHHTILIDTCFGNHKNRGTLLYNNLNTPWLDDLRKAGVAPEQVDYVLCTHLHVDHVGWNTRLVNGRWVPTFPNARYVFTRVDFEDRRTVPGRPGISGSFEDSVLPIVEAGQAVLVDDGHQIDDNIWIELTPGHSPGHGCIHLRSKGRQAMFTGDILHHPIQVYEPGLSSRACADPWLAIATRRQVLERLAETDTLLLPAHFRSPSGGLIRRAGDGYHLIWTEG